MERRTFLGVLSGIGISGGLFPGILWARIQEVEELTSEEIEAAEKLAGLSFSASEREMMLERLQENRSSFGELRRVEIGSHVAPALHFDPNPAGTNPPSGSSRVRPSTPGALLDPGRPEELAFASIVQLGALLREGSVTSVQLTELYLDRLRRLGDRLNCVVTFTDDRAFQQAERADRELEEGLDRGPLHGIPWGAKDLLDTRGYPTTWGAYPFRERVPETDATVVERLDAAGAVLVAKLSLGSLAMGDVWYAGQTLNPWNLEQGASGSSAGSAAASVAGLVGFSIGSETLGSIVSPATRCGATGLRPTFGRVSRHGAMPLSWSMDKLGPLCRHVEDCALVLAAIQGPDGLDRTVREAAFVWDGETWEGGSGLSGLRVGYLETSFNGDGEEREMDREVLRVLAGLGVELEPVELPDDLPISALRIILSAESAASFDDLTRSGQDALLTRQGASNWPNLFRVSRFIPAVEYIQANRIRTLLIAELARAWGELDVVVTPSYASNLLLATNLSGHPVVVLPHGFQGNGTPVSISFVGGLWKDAEAMRLARAYQEATDHHRRRPPGFA